jgi:four helix bundle protein
MSYKEQFIWKRAVQLAIHCYKFTNLFPNSELYGLTCQIRRSGVSVASNIAEGYGRRSRQEYIHFLHIALGSLRELDTQLIIAKEVDLAEKKLFIPIMNEVEEMQSILVATLNKLKADAPTKAKPGVEEMKKKSEKRTV